ncbi:MAG: TnpV protein [Lachnospiraceae bacterium]|nr:TnpV protein [Lachnospiraceae bacterium]
MNLLTSGRLNTCLTDIDRQAQCISERLKAEKALEWAGRMNNVRAFAREMVNKEIIYA